MAERREYQAPVSASPPVANGHAREEDDYFQTANGLKLESLDVCCAPSSAKDLVKRRKKEKEESLFDTLRSWVVQHQIGLAINLLALLALTHICFPRARRRTRTFFELSYLEPSTGRYAQGPDDLYFILYWIVIFTGLRDAVMNYMLLPLAEYNGITKKKSKVRFAEQAWLLLYYGVFWSLGMYIFYNSEYWLNLKELWTDWPNRTMSATLKWYYLVQFAFWIQQILVVNIEERRKDYAQMFTHHIVTCALMITSYGYYETKAGVVILCAMDVVDLILPTAKILKYAGYQTACDIAFGVFILTWILARHVFYLMICWSIYYDAYEVMTPGCYSSATGEMISPDGGDRTISWIVQPFLDPGGPICYNPRMRYVFLSLLGFLQCITIMWLAMILRVAYSVVRGNPADDSRSEDGEEEEEEEDVEEAKTSKPVDYENMAPVEHLVGVEELNLRRRVSPRFRKGGSPGITIPGHSDKKELLGRIGCDKPT